MRAEESSTTVTFAFGGDVMLGRGVAEALDRQWESALAGVRSSLSGADVAFANLESPVTSRTVPAAGAYDLRAPPQAVDALRSAGIDVVSLANNHALDAGEAGLRETIASLGRAGIEAVVGTGVPASPGEFPFRRARPSFALLAFDDSQVPLNVGRAARDVRAATGEDRPVIVSIHWGGEYQAEPSSRQQEIAQALSSAGADVIVGHGPHVPQPVVWVGDTLVAYSLGNLLFDQPYPIDCRWGAILRVALEGRGVVALSVVPTVTRNGLTQVAHGEEARAILSRLNLAPSRSRSTSLSAR